MEKMNMKNKIIIMIIIILVVALLILWLLGQGNLRPDTPQLNIIESNEELNNEQSIEINQIDPTEENRGFLVEELQPEEQLTNPTETEDVTVNE